eukprot:gene6641-7152_t
MGGAVTVETRQYNHKSHEVAVDDSLKPASHSSSISSIPHTETSVSVASTILDASSRLLHSIHHANSDLTSLLSPNNFHYSRVLKRQLMLATDGIRQDPRLKAQFTSFLKNDWLANNDLLPIKLKSTIMSKGQSTEQEEKIHVTMYEFYQQMMYNFLFQPEMEVPSKQTNNNNNTLFETKTICSSASQCSLLLESYETIFCDYQIDLSEEPHKKASLLTLMKNRKVPIIKKNNSLNKHKDNIKDKENEERSNSMEDNDNRGGRNGWFHPYLKEEICRDFLLLVIFTIQQEIQKHRYYSLRFPSLLQETSNKPTTTSLCEQNQPQHHQTNEEHENTINSFLSISQKNFIISEQQVSDQSRHKRYQYLNQLYDHAYSLITKNPTEFLGNVAAGKWCESTTFLQHLDGLGVPLMIASVEKDGLNCPLIHVNSAFERLTQYSRNEVMGKSCWSLLEGAKTEKGQKEKVRKALESGRAVKVGIMNHKKDGSSFLNLLSLVPIYDRNGEYRYVVGKLEDVSSHTTTMKSVEYGEDVVYWVGLVLRCL